jgi:hypothetical protein
MSTVGSEEADHGWHLERSPEYAANLNDFMMRVQGLLMG